MNSVNEHSTSKPAVRRLVASRVFVFFEVAISKTMGNYWWLDKVPCLSNQAHSIKHYNNLWFILVNYRDELLYQNGPVAMLKVNNKLYAPCCVWRQDEQLHCVKPIGMGMCRTIINHKNNLYLFWASSSLSIYSHSVNKAEVNHLFYHYDNGGQGFNTVETSWLTSFPIRQD